MLFSRLFLTFASVAAAAAAGAVNITVKSDVVRQHFAGPGFQCEMFLDTATKEYYEQVLAKRWKDLNPGFARVMLHRNRWKDADPIERLKQQLVFLKQATATEVYMTQGLRDVPEGPERQAWAKSIVDELDALLKAGATNVKSYCSTNELSLHGWADLRKNLPLFRAYHQALYDELLKRGTPIKLLATDASPIPNWNTIAWAAQNMDDISGIYGGHHYFNEYPPESPDFYAWFKGKCAWAADLAKSKGKDFILGEFGPAQNEGGRYGVVWATARYYDTPKEPMVGLQVAEGAMAAINAGIYGLAYWSFSDEPDDAKARAFLHWGMMRWMTNGATVRAPYYAYGLLTKFFHGPAEVHVVESSEGLVRASAVRNENTGTWSVAVINRARESIPVSIALVADPGKPFRKYVYEVAHVPATEDGDLQEPAGKVAAKAGILTDALPAESLVVYTTAYDDGPPAPVRELTVSSGRIAGKTLKWEAGPDASYFRIYHDGVRIGSTVAYEFVDLGPTRVAPGDYMVVAVDRSGNAAAPERAPSGNVPKGKGQR